MGDAISLSVDLVVSGMLGLSESLWLTLEALLDVPAEVEKLPLSLSESTAVTNALCSRLYPTCDKH